CDHDADNDGIDAAAGDCDDTRSDVLRDPAPVTGLRVSRAGADFALTWDGQELSAGSAVRYDVVLGPLGPGAWDPFAPFAGATCFIDDVALPSARTPISRSAWLVAR